MADVHSRGRFGRFQREVLSVIDLLLVNALFGILCWWHPDLLDNYARTKWLCVSLAYVPVVMLFEHARLQRTIHLDRVLVESLRAVGVHALVFVTLLEFLRVDDFPTPYFCQYYAMMLVALPLTWGITRLIIKIYRRHGGNYRRVAIVGTNVTARRLADSLRKNDGYGYRIMGFFDNAPAPGFAGIYCGTLDDLEPFIRKENIDEVYYVLSGENEEDLLRCIRMTDDAMVEFRFVPKLSPYVGRRFEMASVEGLPVLTPLANPLNQPYNRFLKRSLDILFSTVALICSPILFIPIAIAVKLSSPGPVFFKQKRTGYKGREFYCLKFRTMRVNDQADSTQATSNDPRKTKVGDFLRRTSLDELPQFINVWRGDMSIVGPRPHMLAHTEQYKALIDRYMIRHMVKPGITGWAQVCGYRGNTDELIKMEKRVRADVWYIEHWSLMLDVKIFIKTIVNGFRGEENAY
ncbi:MAG: undecaprenyl-phosphate glucose phosphotransferase [Muribaculaceae bacterium]|nr:undecaprenyl-phosphate glucose phosphotransferase [Bacteroides sp.]MDE6222618.1 undecaprenyl-phosphate glucose phosphotransferase [Muribaculaceae bacterium]MDE6229327.1 undecaprenyl-phosphate glucose phosphotransferase [Muribaculaceae bacterium]